MDVKLVLVMSCLAVAKCRSNTLNRNAAVYASEEIEELKSEIESIRQLLTNLTQDSVFIEKHALREMKSRIEEIRQAMIQQQNRPNKECPFGFDYLPGAGSCYAIIFEEMTWGNATERCRGIMPGVHLAAITSQEEHNAVANYIRSTFNGTSIISSDTKNWCDGGYLVWMSGQRKTESCSDSFYWKAFDGIEVPFNYTNWGRGEPNCAGSEFCAHLASCKNLAWNDYGCHKLSFSLCEI